MKFHAIGAAAILAVMCSSVVNAQSLKDREYFAAQEKYLVDEEVKFTNEKCDIQLDAKFDWSKPPKPEDRSTYSAYGYCSAVTQAIRRVCESSEMGKDAIKQRIKSLTCGFGPERKIALKDGAISYEINYNSVNDADFVFDYLRDHL